MATVPIRVLLVEDSAADAELIVHELERGGYAPEWQRVETEAALAAALRDGEWDLVTCDFRLPLLDASRALELIRNAGIQAPVIVVSAEHSPRAAVTALKGGAADYVEKQTLGAIVPSIARELHRAEARRARRLLAAAQREWEQRFAAIFQESLDVILIIDAATGTILEVNKSAERLLGYAAGSLSGKDFSTLLPADSPVGPVEQVRVRGDVFEQQEFRCADGSSRPMDLTTTMVEWNGRAVIIATLRDALERRQAEEERARLSAAVEQAVESIMITDPDGRIVYVNAACERMTGYGRAELTGRTVDLLRTSERDAAAFQEMMSALSGEQNWHWAEVQRRKDGTFYEADVVVFPVHESSGRLINYVGLARDVTRERQVEAQLRQAHKLEAIERLAGGIAHDFNNQLTVIKACTQFLLAKLPGDHPGRRDADRINDTVDTSARLIRQLLNFSRPHPIDTRPESLAALVGEMVPMLRVMLGDHIRLEVRSAPEVWPVRADRGRIEQAVMNLVANARDAMTPGGRAGVGDTVTVETANVTLTEREHGLVEDVRPGNYVVLTVRDNGPGIARDVREHIFEPFFTTKEIGQGAGMGLATVFGIVKQHGGHINCASGPEGGTAFRIYFPPEHPVVPRVREAGVEALPARTGRPTVLVAEDEDNLRDLLVRALEDAGYLVHSAGGAAEALELVGRIGTPIDAIVSDVVMPGESGALLARRLRRAYPSLRVLLISGYLAEDLDLADIAGARFLQKPFDIEALLHHVAALLGDPAAGA
ncbi:PAS domain S-box protein [Candidatus Binatia bacterium]|nr:PAS domain S-box protein [Candidatus Binatia bacterium]